MRYRRRMMSSARVCTGLLLCLVVTKTTAAQAPGSILPETIADGHYQRRDVRFDVPSDWAYVAIRVGATPDDETVNWTNPQTGVTFYAWVSRRKVERNSISQLLDDAVDQKRAQRTREGYVNWRVRPDSVRRGQVNGRESLTVIADSDGVRRPGQPRVEWITWVVAPAGRVQFFAQMTPDKLAPSVPQFERSVATVVLPD